MRMHLAVTKHHHPCSQTGAGGGVTKIISVGETNGISFHPGEHDRRNPEERAMEAALVARRQARRCDTRLGSAHSYYRRDWTRALSDSGMACISRRGGAGIPRRTW